MGKKAHWIEGPDDEIPPLEVTAQARSRESPAVAIYARVSGPKQKSIPAQIAICRERCESKGWRPAYILQDHAMSAADLDRPAFQQLMDLIDREAIDVLVCWKLDRVVRSLRQAAELNEFATSHNVGVHSCTEPLDTTTPVGRFIFGNLANAAEFERDILKERTKMGIHARAAQGRWPRPFVPFGYRRAKAKYITPHPEEARMVNQVFEAYIKAESFPEASHL